jgi:hypothetical protein
MNTDFDTAIDFAYANRHGNAFCAKMIRVFEVRGNLTPSQVNTLLRIKAGK